jgi:hypothetical protein
MAMSALERKAGFKAAVTLRQTNMTEAAHGLGVSYNHLILVLSGERRASDRLQKAIAEFMRKPMKEVFGKKSARKK